MLKKKMKNKIKCLVILSFLFIFVSTLNTHHNEGLKLRKQQNHNGMFGVKGQWTGNDCDEACTRENGIICGRVWRECCALGCVGFFQKTCQDNQLISVAQMKCP